MSSRKHHCKHRRTPGGYKRRLDARGLSRAPAMTYYPDLHQDGRKGRPTQENR